MVDGVGAVALERSHLDLLEVPLVIQPRQPQRRAQRDEGPHPGVEEHPPQRKARLVHPNGPLLGKLPDDGDVVGLARVGEHVLAVARKGAADEGSLECAAQNADRAPRLHVDHAELRRRRRARGGGLALLAEGNVLAVFGDAHCREAHHLWVELVHERQLRQRGAIRYGLRHEPAASAVQHRLLIE